MANQAAFDFEQASANLDGVNAALATVYVDECVEYPPARGAQARRVGQRHGHRWCHMWSEDLEALHAMAAKIGMKRAWFQDRPNFPHYDLVPPRRAAAIAAGAVEKPLIDWLREKRAGGAA